MCLSEKLPTHTLCWCERAESAFLVRGGRDWQKLEGYIWPRTTVEC